MTGITLYPETTVLKDKCPCCEKQLEITVKQTPHHDMSFKVSIEKIEVDCDPINTDQGHGSCQRCLELRLKDNTLRPSEEYFNLCNTHFDLIIKGMERP